MEAITQFSQLDLSKSYTYADYLTWKFDESVELIKGKVMRPMAGPSRRHQQLSNRIEFPIASFLHGSNCEMYHAPFDVRLTTAGANGDQQIQTVVQPDICVICDPAKLDDRGCVGAPDWIIEIVSPGNAARDTKTKFDLYEENGVREYWIVYPGMNVVTAYVLKNERYELAGEYIEPGALPVATLPDLALEWAEIFDAASSSFFAGPPLPHKAGGASPWLVFALRRVPTPGSARDGPTPLVWTWRRFAVGGPGPGPELVLSRLKLSKNGRRISLRRPAFSTFGAISRAGMLPAR